MKKPKAPRLVTVAITTTITIIFWVFFTLYRVLTTKPTPSVDPKLIEPIDATLDTTALENLRTSVFFEEGSFVAPTLAPEQAPAETSSDTAATETPPVTPTETTSEEGVETPEPTAEPGSEENNI